MERLKQYLQLAQELNLSLNINIEIDVGLHRGGVQTQQQFIVLLKLIQHNAAYLKLSGLMGYDAHVTKLPKIIKVQKKLSAIAANVSTIQKYSSAKIPGFMA